MPKRSGTVGQVRHASDQRCEVAVATSSGPARRVGYGDRCMHVLGRILGLKEKYVGFRLLTDPRIHQLILLGKKGQFLGVKTTVLLVKSLF